MTNKQYLQALRELGLEHADKRTLRLLGLSRRSCQRIARGDQEVPRTVALLLLMYLRYGLPDD